MQHLDLFVNIHHKTRIDQLKLYELKEDFVWDVDKVLVGENILIIITKIIRFTWKFSTACGISYDFCILSAIASIFKDIDQFLIGSIRTKPHM